MKTKVHTSKAPAAVGPYSQAIKTEKFLFCSGQIPLDPSSMKIETTDIAKQTERVLENLKAVIEAGGAKFENIVKTTVFLTDLGNWEAFNAVYEKTFAAYDAPPPARSTIQVSALPKGAAVEIEAIVGY